ncbi:hypothetical protein GO988_15910 [Hymenobacter sp. HMF4947]|uniref:Uncharacterized protein n=1 Tax=Hymenobacter ginkgonis TaxID=2682976 RepID=A0A7K1THB0_9BACT|nr:hypothetical protein [Hymenobacter ginkgonis]MVN77817.1 hypothetical protein [Hymenobacter ginkgonis]
MSDKKTGAQKSPKTEMDRTFLAIAQQLMAEHNIPSERAMSSELGQNVNFISRIRTGVQSVPADVWGVLISKFNLKSFSIEDEDTPATFNVSRTTNVVGTNTGTANQTNNNYNLSDCEKERDALKAERDSLLKQVELLNGQLKMQATIIEGKDQMLDLLRGGFTRPN